MNLPERPRNPRRGDVFEVAIDSIADGGLGCGRWAALVGPDKRHISLEVRARGALPGERVEVQMQGRRRRIVSGVVTRLLRPSEHRIAPRCEHAWRPDDGQPSCGGCSLQGLDYGQQVALKEEWVRQQLVATGFDGERVGAIIPCDPPWGHRNKMEYSFGEAGDQLGLGMHPPRRRYEVVDLQRCHLQSEPASALVRAVAGWAREEGLQVHSERRGEGWLRTLMVREGKRTGRRLVELCTSDDDLVRTAAGEQPAAQMAARFGDLVRTLSDEVPVDTLYWTPRHAARGERTTLQEQLLFGPPTLSERLHLADGRRLEFEIHPRAFFQPNTLQAELLYGQVMSAVTAEGAPESGRILDLYCGTGTIGLCLAPLGAEVVGIELQPDAVADATRNAARNQEGNVRFLCGDVGAVLVQDGLATPGSATVAVVDPPRSGLSPSTARLVADLAVPRLIYVSCNPAALARDAAILRRAGYRLSSAQPVDMFPHAWHVETVARFDR